VDILPFLKTVCCHPDFQYILGTNTSSDNPVVFLLADLVSLSKQRFEQLGTKTHDVKAFFDKVQKLNTHLYLALSRTH
jgi:hypothetical protein